MADYIEVLPSHPFQSLYPDLRIQVLLLAPVELFHKQRFILGVSKVILCHGRRSGERGDQYDCSGFRTRSSINSRERSRSGS